MLTFLSQPSARAMQGAAIQEELKNGNTISTELLVDIIVSAIRYAYKLYWDEKINSEHFPIWE